ncbi:MAG TPA: beta-ketoacyl-[acyl-carrier-protein] synthase family protein [Chthoniobacterales bacterium]|jgi:3-oxoacyl-[acyl-carrier-protein] synthase II
MREQRPQRRVVITGMGVVAPNGTTLETFWTSVRDAQSAAGPLTRFPSTGAPVKIACEITDFRADKYMDAKIARRLDRSILYGIAAAHLAVANSGLEISKLDPDRVGVIEATSVSNNETAARAEEAYAAKGYRGVSLFAMINGYSGGGSGEISLHLGARGHAVTMSTGSASGNDVMGYAMSMISNDEVDAVVVGGAEAPIIPSIWGTFCQGRVMTRIQGDPKQTMRPFDRTRDGFILGEGAAFLVFEELTHALSRGAMIYAEVLGHGRACESYHPVAPQPDGIGIIRAMEKALRNSGIDLEEVDYVNAHGTATEANDLVESKAIQKFFGGYTRRLAVSSTKPITGHLMAAAGAVETVVCALVTHHQVIPPTANLRNPEAGMNLDFVPLLARPYPVRAVMNLSSGFGGKNACLLMRRFDPLS